MALRTAVADAALRDTLEWLEREGDVAIFDATNTTRQAESTGIRGSVGGSCLFLISLNDG